MIRSYSINELEELAGINRRTISDYITKGLLTGPSHRGRGAVYSQRDLNVLQVIPRLRTLLKEEYGSLKAVAAFLDQLSVHDIHILATRQTERAFIVEVRRLRVRLSLMDLMPHLAPERIDEVLQQLTPEQICGVDSGRVQIGAVLDMGSLFSIDNGSHESAGRTMSLLSPDGLAEHDDDTDRLPQLSEAAVVEAAADKASSGDTRQLLTLKLDEIASRLDRVEQMLDYENE